ncbi:MAG: hypothetical protein FWE09_00035 [Treponema sp.]|nr:hypothetical protein [Treponema sp.]
MRNNAEIRKRMETYRKVLLALNWVCPGILLIAIISLPGIEGGFLFGLVLIILLLAIIGHFLINVSLAIPFILLNNGDTLEYLREEMGELIAGAQKASDE